MQIKHKTKSLWNAWFCLPQYVILFATMLCWKVEAHRLVWFCYIDLCSMAGCQLFNFSLDCSRLWFLAGYCSFYFTGGVNWFEYIFGWRLLKSVNEMLLDQRFENMKNWVEFMNFTNNSNKTDSEKNSRNYVQSTHQIKMVYLGEGVLKLPQPLPLRGPWCKNFEIAKELID